jgi:signal recognition particle subunit SRP68
LVHQYIVYLLLSHRIRRDLLLVETLSTSSTALPSDPTVFKIPGGRSKTEEAVKSLAAVIKLYDAVLQSMSQLRSLAVVEEKEGVRLANEGLEAYFHATRSVLAVQVKHGTNDTGASTSLDCIVSTPHRPIHPPFSS